jgi:ABC-type Mn2+/Zn2+ transport system permease subunit
VIADFVASWPLFQSAILSGWLIAIALSLIGVLVVARNQIFVGAAAAQASALGIAISLWAGPALAGGAFAALGGDEASAWYAVAFSIAAALFAGGRPAPGRESLEAKTGWVFLASSSASILILAHSPHGLEEIHRLLSSSLIGAVDADVFRFAVIAATTAAVFFGARSKLILIALDPETASALGVRVAAWNGALACWLGVVSGLSIRAAGMLYAFGCLVLPALAAKAICREVRGLFVAAPVIALGAAVAGFVLAHRFDLPPAPTTTALLAGAVAVARLVPRH